MIIDGKLALVTGSSKRIGRAIAVELGRRGARVAVHYRSSGSEAAAQETLRLVREAGGDGAEFEAELTRVDHLDKMFNKLQAAFGGLHVLVNNASVFSPASADETTEMCWDEQMNSNAKAPFFVAQRAAKLMNEGKII